MSYRHGSWLAARPGVTLRLPCHADTVAATESLSPGDALALPWLICRRGRYTEGMDEHIPVTAERTLSFSASRDRILVVRWALRPDKLLSAATAAGAVLSHPLLLEKPSRSTTLGLLEGKVDRPTTRERSTANGKRRKASESSTEAKKEVSCRRRVYRPA
jgi:hypothetical protein